MKKIYIGAAVLVVFGLLVGVILPWLFSAKSTIAVSIAIFISLSAVLGFIHVVYHKLNKEIQKDENR